MDAPPANAHEYAAHAHAAGHAAHLAVHHRHGSWAGHVLPGSLFLLWGCWWLLRASAEHARGRAARAGGKVFQARPWWPLSAPRRPAWASSLEPRLKLLLPLAGVVVELFFHPGDVYYRAATDAGSFVEDNLNNWQHAAMYLAFAFSGLVDLSLAPPVSRIAGFASLSLAFAIELLLFWFHLRMQTGLMSDVHLLLCGAVAGCAAAMAAEATLVGSGAFAPTLARCFFTLLQGTWFFQTAHILYGAQPWDPDDMSNSMMLPVVFVAHMLAVGAFMLAVFKYVGASSWCLMLCGRRDKDELPVLLGLLPAPAKRAPLDNAGDSED